MEKREIKAGNPSLSIEQIEVVLNSFIKNKIHIPLMIWGKPGIGKSAIVKKVAKDNGYDLIDIRLSQKESVDIIGMPVTSTIEINGESHNVLDFHPPSWFVKALFNGNCILFFDEINRGRREVLQAVFQIVYDKTLNGKKLPDTVYQCAACNPPSDGEDVLELGDALNDRFLHVVAEPNVDEWVKWAEKNKIKPEVIEFAQTSENFFGKPTEFTLRDLNLESGGRTAERASVVEGLDIADNVKMVLYMGLFGIETGMEFWQSIQESSEKVVSLEDLEKLTETTKNRIKKYAGKDSDEQRIDLLKRTCLKIEKDPKAWQSYYENIVFFFSEIPLNLAHTTLKALFHKMEHQKEYIPFVEHLSSKPFMKKIQKLNLQDFDPDEDLESV